MTTYFKYDSFNKLAQELDHNGNILKQYTYNYFTVPQNPTPTYYNQQLSQVFTKNDCTGGAQVTYTVLAGSYSSHISQADANAKAQNDIDLNGQNYANANGNCSSPGTVDIMLGDGDSVSDIGDYTYIEIRDGGNNNSLFSEYAFQLQFPYNATIPASSNGCYSIMIIPGGMNPLEVNINGDIRDLYYSSDNWSIYAEHLYINISTLY
jgi:hypothetical protein